MIVFSFITFREFLFVVSDIFSFPIYLFYQQIVLCAIDMINAFFASPLNLLNMKHLGFRSKIRFLLKKN